MTAETRPFMPIETIFDNLQECCAGYADGDNPGWFRIHWNSDTSDSVTQGPDPMSCAKIGSKSYQAVADALGTDLATAKVPTLTTVEAATALLTDLAEEADWVSVFWDRGWGDADLEISVIVGGNGQKPIAFITDTVYRTLLKSGTIRRNTLQTFKARKLHNFKSPSEVTA